MTKKLIILMLSVFLILSGCSDNVNVEETKDNIDSAIKEIMVASPQRGGQIKLSMRTPKTLNPLLNEDESVDSILRIIYEPLIKIDERFKPVPNIAESWEMSPNGNSVTLKIKDNILWHDGSTLTADDVLFSFNTLRLSDENSVYKECVKNIAACTKVNNTTLNFTFTKSFSGNMYYLTFPIISSAYYKKENVLTSKKNMVPMGTGAFKFESLTEPKEMYLSRFDSSFGKSAYIDNIDVIITSDRYTDISSFDQGIIDAVMADVAEFGKYDNSNNIKKFEFTTNYYDFIGFNFNNSALRDKNVRKAIAYAIPKQNLIDSIYLNHAVAAQTPIVPQSWLYDAQIEDYQYSLTESKSILEASNWKIAEGENIRKRRINEFEESLKLSILVNNENKERKQVALKIAEELKSVGFDINIESVPYDEYAQRLQDKNFDIFIGGWEFSPVTNLSFLFATGGSNNFISYSSEGMDNLLSTANTAVGDDAILQAYSNLQQYIHEELPYISLVFRKSAVFTSGNIYGNIQPIENNIYNNIEDWYLYND